MQSAYAIDHLNRQGTDQSLAEAARVLKPGGELWAKYFETQIQSGHRAFMNGWRGWLSLA